jgi:hypothetical protein
MKFQPSCGFFSPIKSQQGHRQRKAVQCCVEAVMVRVDG